MELLPEDVLADVLRRLPPRGMAVSRSVWLPTKLGGIFIKISEPGAEPEFWSGPLWRAEYCNGLLLLEEYDQVVNPATRQWARLPPYLDSHASTTQNTWHLTQLYHLLHTTTRCLLCKILFVSDISYGEWPPSVYVMGVYSSSTRKWEERSFAREQGSATTLAYFGSGHEHAVYLNRALYTYWRGDFIMRITLFNDKYKIINLPTSTNTMSSEDKVYLGKSKNRIHFALVDHDQIRLQIWFLNESGGKTEWIFKHGANLMQISYFPKHGDHETDRPWILQYDNYYHENNKEPEPTTDIEGLDWNSDEDNALDIDDDMGHGKSCFPSDINILGFHPYKEILFLCLSDSRFVAYYFNASKIQDLGECCIVYRRERTIGHAFVYTPCWNRELFAEK